METHPLTARNWLIVAAIAIVAGIWFIAPFLGVVALAALMAFLFSGTYYRLHEKRKAGTSAALTFLFSLAVVLVPIILIFFFTVFQLGQLIADITNTFGGNYATVPEALQSAINNVNALVASLGGSQELITSEGVSEFLRTALPAVLGSLTSSITTFIGSIPFTIIMAIMYIFLFFEFLIYGKKIVASIVALSPFQPEVTRMYLARVGLMANAMAKGELVISVIVAILEAATLAFFFGIWDYFLLMTVAFSLFNLVPLGAGILFYPIIIIFMLFGQVWPGIGALITVTAVSNIESFIRPKFIPKSITLTNGLTMLAAFGGIALYGVIGVVYGPIIMIVIVTSIQMYLDYYQELPRWKRKANKTTS
jgi:predicted PurR-regulated permease PerM